MSDKVWSGHNLANQSIASDWSVQSGHIVERSLTAPSNTVVKLNIVET